MERNKLLARFIALHGVRNSELENLHCGVTPSTKSGDYSDVKVVTPYGEIPWSDVSRISDVEMRKLMLDIEKKIKNALGAIELLERESGSKNFEKMLKEAMFANGGASWDNPQYIKRR
jgi:hypothetical protein